MNFFKIHIFLFTTSFFMACGGGSNEDIANDTGPLTEQDSMILEEEVKKMEAESEELDKLQGEIEEGEAELNKMMEDL